MKKVNDDIRYKLEKMLEKMFKDFQYDGFGGCIGCCGLRGRIVRGSKLSRVLEECGINQTKFILQLPHQFRGLSYVNTDNKLLFVNCISDDLIIDTAEKLL